MKTLKSFSFKMLKQKALLTLLLFSSSLSYAQLNCDGVTQMYGMFNLLRSKEFGGLVRNQSFRLIGQAVECYARSAQQKKAVQLISIFKNPVNRSSLYAYAAWDLLRRKHDGPVIQELIDSAVAEMNRIESSTNDQPNRNLLAHALVMQSPAKNTTEAYRLIKNLPVKFNAIQNICRSYAFYGDLHEARSNIPSFISSSDQSAFLWYLLYGYNQGTGMVEEEWRHFSNHYPEGLTNVIAYIDENN